MFRLFRMGAYALLGYALYEFFIGLTGDSQSGGSNRGSRQSQNSGRSNSLTGSSGQGMTTETLDPDGGRAAHTVGRGVIR